MHRADIHDAALPLQLAKFVHKLLRQKVRALQVHRHHLVIIVFVHLPEHGLLFQAGIVHQDVHCSELVDGSLDQVLPILGLGDVGSDGDPVRSCSLHALQRLLRAIRRANVVDDDLCAVLRKTFCNPLSNALPRPGDNCNLVSKISHSLYAFFREMSRAAFVSASLLGCRALRQRS